MCFQETSVFKYMFYAQKENSERKQKHHNEYKNCKTLPSVFLLCDCQKTSLENSGMLLRTSRKGRYALLAEHLIRETVLGKIHIMPSKRIRDYSLVRRYKP